MQLIILPEILDPKSKVQIPFLYYEVLLPCHVSSCIILRLRTPSRVGGGEWHYS